MQERIIDNRNRCGCADLQFFWTVQFTLFLICFFSFDSEGAIMRRLHCIHVETRIHNRAHRGRYRPMQMLVVSEMYKNYQNYQLTNFGRGGGVVLEGEWICWYDVTENREMLCTHHSVYKNLPLYKIGGTNTKYNIIQVRPFRPCMLSYYCIQ